MICKYKEYVYLKTVLNFWFIIRTASKVIAVWNFDLRIFSVYGRGTWLLAVYSWLSLGLSCFDETFTELNWDLLTWWAVSEGPADWPVCRRTLSWRRWTEWLQTSLTPSPETPGSGGVSAQTPTEYKITVTYIQSK